MNILAKNKTNTFKNVWFSDESVFVVLSNNQEVSSPLRVFPRLANATKKQLNDFELICGNTGIHWEALDEDLSAEGFLVAATNP